MSAYSFDNFNTYTQVCSLTPPAPSMINYNTNISTKKFHDLDNLSQYYDDDNNNNNNNFNDNDYNLDQDDENLFELEDVDTKIYNSNSNSNSSNDNTKSINIINNSSSISTSSSQRNITSNSLPSLMLDSNISSDDEEYDYESEIDDYNNDIAIINNDWNQSPLISPYLHPTKSQKKSQFNVLTFDSILSSSSSSPAYLKNNNSSSTTVAAVNNYNLWLSSSN